MNATGISFGTGDGAAASSGNIISMSYAYMYVCMYVCGMWYIFWNALDAFCAILTFGKESSMFVADCFIFRIVFGY